MISKDSKEYKEWVLMCQDSHTEKQKELMLKHIVNGRKDLAQKVSIGFMNRKQRRYNFK